VKKEFGFEIKEEGITIGREGQDFNISHSSISRGINSIIKFKERGELLLVDCSKNTWKFV